MADTCRYCCKPILDLHRAYTLEQYDAISWRLELAARLQGASAEELRELTVSRERERARLAETIDGFCTD